MLHIKTGVRVRSLINKVYILSKMRDNVDTTLDKHMHKVDTIYDVDIYPR